MEVVPMNLERAQAAFIGAAVGDALGWPFEGRASQTPHESQRQLLYFAWDKKSGGRFNPHVEHIAAGEYSDDTQLILAVSRSLITTSEWWQRFATVELPVWTIYERGGGGATKRAAVLWTTGTAPWNSRKAEDAIRYINAGGNGVAMRVLPHCVRHASNDSFSPLATDILSDGVVTHGHPRALIGALAYGYACWSALRLSRTLEYGELIQKTLEGFKQWSSLPELTARWSDWYPAATKLLPDYVNLWESVSDEMYKLLNIARRGVENGSVVSTTEILSSLGTYDQKQKGAGTVSAAAAIYLASRYAASPTEGLARSAFAIGTDTDTIASMTGALLGAIGGLEWLSKFKKETQDADYIQRAATLVANGHIEQPTINIKQVRKTTLQKVIKEIEASNGKQPTTLPNGIEILNIQPYRHPIEVNTKNSGPRFWKISTVEGPTLFIRGSTFASTKKPQKDQPATINIESTSKQLNFNISGIGISLNVQSITRSREFYEGLLGLQATALTSKTVRLEQVIALREVESKELFPSESIRVFLHVSDVLACREKMQKNGIKVKDITERGRAKSFECLDPDGYIIEIFERDQAC